MVQRLRLHLPVQGFWVQSLVRELRCYELWGKKTKHKKQKQYCNKFNIDFKNCPFFKNLKKTPQLPHWVIVRIKWVNKYKHLLSTGHRVVCLSDFICSFIFLAAVGLLHFPGGSDGEESACNAGDLGSIPGLGRSPGEGNGNPLQYSCLENSMNGGTWRATVHGVTKSRTRLSD